MTRQNPRGLFLKLAALFLLAACLALLTSKATYSRLATGAPQVLTVQVESQPQSPLQFSSTKVLSPDPFSPNIEFTVINKGEKAIRAYTVTRELVTDGGSRKAALFTHLAAQREVLQPRQSKTGSVNEPYSPLPVRNVILSIDFVEFVNGETWGADVYNSAQRLAGQERGVAAALEHFRKVRAEKGASTLLEAVTSEEEEIAPPEGGSPEWQDGFKTGVALMRLRLKRAEQGGGLKGVELELRQPFDTPEGGPE